MKKVVLIIIASIVIVALIIFFYPKDAGSTCGFCLVGGIEREEYDCIGFKYENRPDCLDCGIQIKCIGIVVGQKKCYTSDAKQPPTYTEVPCN